jgi:hypothetical protein
MVAFGGEINGFRYFLSLYLAFWAFRGAIWLLSCYMVVREKPKFQKVLCHHRLGQVDLGI